MEAIGNSGLTITQAVRVTGRHRNTIYRWIMKFNIGRKVGGRWFIDRSQLQAVLDGSTQTPTN
mgnify:CR=1 FL=1